MMTENERVEGGNTIKYLAGQFVRQLNDEMEALGYIIVRGRVDTNYFRKNN